ncbi:hypothetical protein RRF57_001821 [Xylaria bambusicola]|uniref:Uncharacterized protein n=1 Tax=Xylaria bambusicola TaxID=326684 RepID=A0AAN7Z6G7_9PEZI
MRSTAVLPILVATATANPVGLEQRQNCPGVFVFGARETTAPPGFGTSGGLVNMVTAANPGSQSSAINYPACGGQASCGGVDYNSSANQGTAAVISAVNDLNRRCPNTKIGGQIMDNALCGGAGNTLSGAALNAVKAAVFMGDPHNVAGLPFNVGTCRAGGFAARPQGFQCSPANSFIIQSYCDAGDPFCCNGNDPNTHQSYVNVYGNQAFNFIQSLL